jgi:hypothetical protein
MRVTSLEELGAQLAPGDFITVVPANGQPVAGRLTRIDPLDLSILTTGRSAGPRDLTIPIDGILSLERRRDPVRNGAVLGAAIGAGIGGGLFLTAAVVDLNEMTEWAPIYAGMTAAATGIGALIGWAMDAARSKPHIRFDASGGKTTLNVQPMYARGVGIGLALSISK